MSDVDDEDRLPVRPRRRRRPELSLGTAKPSRSGPALAWPRLPGRGFLTGSPRDWAWIPWAPRFQGRCPQAVQF